VPESNSKPSLFKEFDFENYTILVGRNSKNNDVLTFQHAHKEDIWLHAKGVSGSHVIVKRKGSGGIPEPVINRAAELAAYFSKAKSSSMVLVMYTERKFVRKFKSALPGQVIVEKEHTILVEPKLN
jgi:predicted ribosome quality control (RQC) complex YloA/Tae2 family protein